MKLASLFVCSMFLFSISPYSLSFDRAQRTKGVEIQMKN